VFDLRRGIGRIGLALLAIWELPWVGIIAYRIVAGPPNVADPDAMSLTQLALILLALMIGPPLVVIFLWRALLWIGRGFVRSS
jgi:hypothetical protein